MAANIPKGNTPGCNYTHFPLPILAECKEPLAAGADDIRGLWQEINGDHVERIEQCGRRVVVTRAELSMTMVRTALSVKILTTPRE